MVSIVMPLYNAEDFVAEAVESVVGQTYSDWELLIVDDGLTDGSIDVASRYERRDNRVRVLKMQQNAGAAAARNLGTEHARGRFIAFLDADDVWLPNKLQRQVDFMNANEVHLSYTSYAAIDEAGERTGLVFDAPEEMTYSRLLMTNFIGCSTAIYSVDFCGKMMFPDLRRRQDYGLWLSILKLPHVYAAATPGTLVLYRIRKTSVSSNKLRAARYNWILYRRVEKLGVLKSLFYLASYVIVGLSRRARRNAKQ